ncbi:heterokaryon incompatibility protein-domain-containing protein [Fusarium avenaceum]|nr:heterokaryon incompatibility protein-domain-containing protein [Fusarium avenaceum]
MNQHRPFKYDSVRLQTPSTEIRLLDLYPSQHESWQNEVNTAVASDWQSRLICRLYTTKIEKPACYTALSYVWGAGRKSRSIWVTNLSSDGGEASIPITESLNTALLSLSHTDKITTLWIDQICINQADEDEKGEQVAMMGNIYSAANQVLVWLGPAENGSDQLMDAWQDIGQGARDFGLDSYKTSQGYYVISAMMRNETPTDKATMHLQDLLAHTVDVFAPLLKELALKAWFDRPYFSRAWIVQEFCLCADTVFVCGTKAVAVDLVGFAVTMLHAVMGNMPEGNYTKLQPPEMPLERLEELSDGRATRLFVCRSRHQKYADDELHVLLRKLFVGHDTRATEHRDRVFALLGLAVDAQKLGIKPDYNYIEGSTERILTQTARVMIEKAGRVDILCYSQFPKVPELAKLESWVPDWRSNLLPSFYTIHERSEDHLFAASGQESVVETTQSLEDDASILGLRGYTVDTIERVADGDAWLDLSWDHVRYLGFFAQVDILWQDSLKKDFKIFGDSTDSRKQEARWRVPIGDIYLTWEGDQHRASSDAAKFHSHLLRELNMFDEMTRSATEENGEGLQDTDWDDGSQTEEIKHNYRQSMKKMQGKRPFLTRLGYLGWGPAEGQPGDVVVIFCGGRIPFVLRPVDNKDEEEMFSFVGEAYCDGIMDGEATVGQKQTFWLT